MTQRVKRSTPTPSRAARTPPKARPASTGPLAFPQWIARQTRRHGAIGALARDVAIDRRIMGGLVAMTPETIRHRFTVWHATPAKHSALDDALAEYARYASAKRAERRAIRRAARGAQ